jgi:hypothetical protein
MRSLDPSELPFSGEACPIAVYSRRHGGVIDYWALGRRARRRVMA